MSRQIAREIIQTVIDEYEEYRHYNDEHYGYAKNKLIENVILLLETEKNSNFRSHGKNITPSNKSITP